jgi:DNA-binding SARP family transcriptional activator
MGTLEIKLFGTLRVQRPGRPVTQFPTKRVKDLFSYLLIRRHTLHPRESLAELFWDGTKENNPRHCLNTALWRLQRVLGESEPGSHPYLRVDAHRIGFNTASDARLDVAEFENRCLWAEQLGGASAEQQAALYHQALDFYQADLLVDCYEEWCLVERERLQRVYLHALDFLIDHHGARREFREATDCAQRLLANDPLREDIHRKLIHSLLAAGQPAAALRQYQTCKTVLERELGAAPTQETRALLPRIFAKAGATPVPAGRPAESVPPAPAGTAGGERVAAAIGAAGAGRERVQTPSDPYGALATALGRLRAAVADLDRAHAEVRASAVAAEELMRDLMPAWATRADVTPTGHVSERVLSGRAAVLVAGDAAAAEGSLAAGTG